jgi:hypothetical protein
VDTARVGRHRAQLYLNGIGIVRDQVTAMHAGAFGLVAATTIVYAVTLAGLGRVFRARILAPIGQPARIDELLAPWVDACGLIRDTSHGAEVVLWAT